MTQNIDYIIFDLGGVIYDVDYHATIEELSQIGGRDFSAFFSQTNQETLVDQFEEGKISENDFFDALQDLCTSDCSREELKAAWNKMLLGFRQESIAFLKDLGKEMPIYLFSNNNVTHYKAIQEEVGESHLVAFNDLFIKTYYSHTFGKRKPHTGSFSALLELEGLDASRGLFIDDSPQHLLGAETVGLYVKRIELGERIENLLGYLIP